MATKRRRLIKAGEAKKAQRPQAAVAATAAAGEGQPSRQRLPADAAGADAAGAAPAAPAAPFVIPRTQQAAQPEGRGQAEAGEPSESSAVTEDIVTTAFMGEEEVQQAVPAGSLAAAVRRPAAVDAQQLEASLEGLVHMPSRHRRAERRKRLLQAAEVGEGGRVSSHSTSQGAFPAAGRCLRCLLGRVTASGCPTLLRLLAGRPAADQGLAAHGHAAAGALQAPHEEDDRRGKRGCFCKAAAAAAVWW